MRLKGYIGLTIVCFLYWVLDSIWSYFSFEYNLRKLIFSEPGSYIDTFFLRVPPYQIVSRLMVVALFAISGSVILEFIIKRQAAEKDRREGHDTLLTVLNSIDATIYVADMQNHEILFMNQYMIDSFGGNFSGDTCHKVFRHSAEVCDHCTNDQLLDEAGDPKGVVVWEGRNPITKAWYMNYDRAIKWLDGRIVRLQIATDITQLKELQKKQLRAEAQLRQAQKMESIGTLAGGIAHDFNNILYPIIGMSELLLEDLPFDSLEYENTQEILNAGKRGRDLVRQILAFSRQSEHKMKPVRIQRILKEALKLSRSTIPSNIEILEDIQHDCGLVLADPTQLHQVSMNLITNAYHAVEQNGGKISIQLKETELGSEDRAGLSIGSGQYALLTISDTGCGIDPALVDKIFDPYFTTKEQGKGTGLGLAVVHGIVNEHQGDIKIYSEVGKGSTLNVFLPLMEKTFEAESVERVEKHKKGAERILLVDDEEAIANLGRQMLERLGYRVTSRVNSVEALEAFRANPDAFDLVITDMTMPNITGDQLANELISIRPDISIIICTGFSERMTQEKAKAMGIKGFLMKPVIKSELGQEVRKVLDGKNEK